MNTLTPDTLRQLRVASRIPGSVVCGKVGVSRSRLSQLERGYVQPKNGELERIAGAIDSLVEARKTMERVAVEAGWPANAI
jgi:transcriptional regulator with XRE-family HTH domain